MKTLQKYINDLIEFLKDNPETASYIVVTSKDDEGNGYDTVHYDPTIGCYDVSEREFHLKSYYDELEDDDNDDDDAGFLPSFVPNAICVN